MTGSKTFDLNLPTDKMPTMQEFRRHILKMTPPEKRLALGCQPVMLSFSFVPLKSNMESLLVLEEVDDTTDFPIAHCYIEFWHRAKLQGRLVTLSATVCTAGASEEMLFKDEKWFAELNSVKLSHLLIGSRTVN